MFYVYILHSEKDGLLYTGYTSDIRNRLKAHKGGFVRSTQKRLPVRLIFLEVFLVEKDAKRREKYLKGGNGKRELSVMLKTYFEKHPWNIHRSLSYPPISL